MTIGVTRQNIEIVIGLMFGVTALVSIAVLSVVLMKMARKADRHGFEVKLETGEEPVIEKKENDHG